jgi:hypothetical protein
MCAKADYREGFRVLAQELRRLMRGVAARWRRRPTQAPVFPITIGHAPLRVK